MIRKRIIKRRQPTIFVKANHQIRFPEVRVLDERGEMLGVMPTRQAQDIALTEGKDLVLVTEKAQPPIVKVIDLAKFKYQQQQKEAENRKKAKGPELKELQFSPFIGEGDLQTKLKRVFEFLNRGDKVRLTVDFKSGRQMSKKEFGYEVLKKIFEATSEVATIETQPQFQGKKLTAQLMPAKKQKPKEPAAAPESTASEA
ncbi:MAG TPA: translation initiation factor IF-3 [Vitreimonas sp.]|nr:translation initiation factor IF-3 [Vitreimonas sp.]